MAIPPDNDEEPKGKENMDSTPPAPEPTPSGLVEPLIMRQTREGYSIMQGLILSVRSRQ